MRGVFYRSDTRSPTEPPDQIFKRGFSKRDRTYAAPRLRLPMGANMAPDIVPQSAVCFTRDFLAAPLFPVSDLACDSWVYVLDIDVSKVTNTQQSQYEYVGSVGRLGAAEALWPMFGQERAVDRIAPHDIVGAVRVNRRFNGGDVFNGGDFRPTRYVRNAGYSGPTTTANLASKLITPLVQANAWIAMPTMAQGIVQSTGR